MPPKNDFLARPNRTPWEDPRSFEPELFNYREPGMFRSYAAPLVLLAGSVLVILALLFLR